MAGLLDLFSGRSSDIYGNGLLTPEQRGGLGNIGLLALAGKLGQLAGPSFSPVPDFGAALGQAAGAYGASQEGAGTAALNAILTGQKGRKLEQELDYYKQLGPILGKLAGQWPGADGGTATTPETGSTGGGAAAPLGAGGGGGGAGGGGGVPAQYAELINQAAAKENVDPAVLTSLIGHESSFRPDIRGASGEVGLAQLMPGTAQSLGVTDRTDPTQSIFAAARYLRQGLDAHGGDYTMALRYYNGGPGGVNKPQTLTYANTVLGGAKRYGGTAAAPTAAAPDSVRVPYNYGAPSGGLLNLPQVPNFSARLGGAPQADVGETVAPADVAPNRVGRFAGVAPGTPVNSGGFPYNPEITDPAVAARVAQSMAAIKQAQQSGVPWAAPRETSGSSTDPIMSVTSADQAGGGDAPGGMASGLLAPGGPLTRGVPGMPPMPPAAAPSADPSLQLGPLAPAPAAAAPAAPGPGLLSPPGMPAAAALPRINPAFDAYARNLAVAAGLVKGAGLPDALTPLLEVFKSSPAYKAQSEIATRTAAQPFEQAQTLFNKQVEIAGVGPIEAAKLPYALAQTYFKAEQDLRIAGPVAAAQNFERIRADNAAKGIITTKDADGNIKLAIDPDAVKAVSGATSTVAGDTTRAQEQAKADVAAGTAPGIARETETQKGFAAQDTAARAQALASREGLFLLGDARQQLEGAGIFSGALANPKMTLAQYYSGLTGVPNEQLINTQVFLQQAGARAAAILQSGTYGTGTGVGQRDLDAANKLANGDNTVDLATIKRVFDLTEKTAHRKIEMFNDMIRKRDPGSVVEPPPASASAGTAGSLDFSRMSLPDLTAAVTRGDLTMDQRRAIDKRFRELGH